MEIKDIKLEDLMQFKEVYRNYFNTYEDACWTDETVTRKFFQLVNRYDYLGLGLYNDQIMIGFAVGQLIQFDDGLVALLNELFVIKSMQSKGFGSKLLKAFEDLAKNKGAFRIQLESANDHMHHRFYNELNHYLDTNSNILKAKSLED